MALTVAPIKAQQSPYRAIPSTGPKPTYVRNPLLALPIEPLPERVRTSLREIKLFVKTPGSDWKCALTGSPSQTMFEYRAEKDGEYAFIFVTVNREGRFNPPSFEGRAPHQIIVVDTQPPQLGVVQAPIGNSELYLKVEMIDANPNWASVKLEYPEGAGWKSFPGMGPNSPGIFRVHDRNLLEGKIRISAIDLAGNFGTKFVDLSDQTQRLGLSAQPKSEPGALPVGIAVDPPPMQLNGKITETNFSQDLKMPNDAGMKKDLPPLDAPIILPDAKSGTDTSLKIPVPPVAPAQSPIPIRPFRQRATRASRSTTISRRLR